MLTRVCSASVRRSSRCRSQRSTSTTWCAPWPLAGPAGCPAAGGDGRSSRSPPSAPVRTHPAWHDQTQRARGEEEIDLWRDDLHPRARVLFVKPCGDRHRCQSGSQSRRENLSRRMSESSVFEKRIDTPSGAAEVTAGDPSAIGTPAFTVLSALVDVAV